MELNKKAMLAELKNEVSDYTKQAQLLLTLSHDDLNTSVQQNSWSILQIIDHLNTYNSYYLPKIKTVVINGSKCAHTVYKTSMLGNYFVKLMQPANNVITKKYKAAKIHLPKAVLDVNTINGFINDQQELLNTLEEAKYLNLITNKIPVSISPIIKLRLGDVYRFLIAHQQRHFLQINNNLKFMALTAQKDK